MHLSLHLLTLFLSSHSLKAVDLSVGINSSTFSCKFAFIFIYINAHKIYYDQIILIGKLLAISIEIDPVKASTLSFAICVDALGTITMYYYYTLIV